MRSSRSSPDPLDPGSAGFAHRGLHGPGVPENSMAAFEAAVACHAGIECDLRLTADGVPMVFHDRDAQRLCGSSVILSESHADDLAGLRLGGTDERIPRLADLLSLARGKVPLLLELKDERNSVRFAASVVEAIQGYGGPVGVMSFASGVSSWLSRSAPSVRRGLVLSGRDLPLARWAKQYRADPDFIAARLAELGQPWARSTRRRIPIYGWTVRTAAERETARVQADALIWEADGRP